MRHVAIRTSPAVSLPSHALLPLRAPVCRVRHHASFFSFGPTRALTASSRARARRPVRSAEDLISAVQFDDTGDYLATGDRGGRVVIFESSEVTQRAAQLRDGAAEYSPPRDVEYRFYCEFQSHEPEFDYLKSLEIEEKINRIRWRRGRAGPLFLLSTNDKTIKLWKIYEKKVRGRAAGAPARSLALAPHLELLATPPPPQLANRGRVHAHAAV